MDYTPVLFRTRVPVSSPDFKARRFWQGPVWINLNWLIADGLERYEYNNLANDLRRETLELVQQGGMHEYFSALTGKPAGAAGFSWTAALTIDILATIDTHK